MNGHLAIDLGGSHPQIQAQVNLDDHRAEFELTSGQMATIDVFTAQRRESESDIQFRTNVNLEPNGQYAYQVQAIDEDPDSLMYTLVSAPEGMSIHPRRGLILWNPSSVPSRSVDVVVRVTNRHGLYDEQSYHINRPPKIVSVFRDSAVRAGTTLVRPVVAVDPDGDTLHYVLRSLGVGQSIDAVTGVITWHVPDTASGSIRIPVGVDDGRLSDTSSMRLVIQSLDPADSIPVSGVGFGVRRDSTRDELSLEESNRKHPVLWIPNSQGTVSKIDTRNGRELARYWVVPVGSGGYPSRTAVDQYGNVWAASGSPGLVTKIGLEENGQCVDRNGDGVISTSRDLNGDGSIDASELLPWAGDECVLLAVVLNPGNERTGPPAANIAFGSSVYPNALAIDARNDLWVGTTRDGGRFYLLEGVTGRTIRSVAFTGGGMPSNAVMDREGVLWSLVNNDLMRLDVEQSSPGTVRIGTGLSAVGLALDTLGRAWISGGGMRSRVQRDSMKLEWVHYGPPQDQGSLVTEDQHAWVASCCQMRVARYDRNDNQVAWIPVGTCPSGLDVDDSGKIWVAMRGEDKITRINPVTNTVDLTRAIGNSAGVHYAISQMTGNASQLIVSGSGVWRYTQDGLVAGRRWARIDWEETRPTGASIRVRARALDDTVLESKSWFDVANGQQLLVEDGRFLQVEVSLRRGDDGTSPIVRNLSIWANLIHVDRPRISTHPDTSVLEGTMYSYAPVAESSNGLPLAWSLTVAPEGMVSDSATGSLRWQTDSADIGVHSVALRVMDPKGIANLQTWTVRVRPLNHRPQLVGPDTLTVWAGDSVRVLFSAKDPDRDTLVWTNVAAPRGAELRSEMQGYVWMPDTTQLGLNTFTLEVGDGELTASAIAVVSVRRHNRMPSITSQPQQQVQAGDSWSYDAEATDPDGDSLAWTLEGPVGMRLVNGGRIVWPTMLGDVGVHAVKLIADDGQGGSSSQTFGLRVAGAVNQPPEIRSVPDRVAEVVRPWSYQAIAVDADGDTLTWSLLKGPDGAIMTPAGLLAWTPPLNAPAAVDLSIEVDDGHGHVTRQDFRLPVVPDYSVPEVSLRLDRTRIAVGDSIQAVVRATDDRGVSTLGLTDNGASVEFGADGVVLLRPTQDGEHILVATASDATGNTAHATQKYTVVARRDTLPPVVRLHWTPSRAAVGDTVRFVATMQDESGIDTSRAGLIVAGNLLPWDDGLHAAWVASAGGAYAVSLVGYDKGGLSSRLDTSLRVDVGNPPGAASIQASLSAPVALADTAGFGSADPVVTDSALVAGRATATDFAYWTLSAASVGSADWIEFRRGTQPVSGGAFGWFDASLRENGPWQIRLQVFDKYGRSAQATTQIQVSGERKVGGFAISFLDLEQNLSGMPLRISRTYDTRDLTKGDFGYGWKLDIASGVRIHENRSQGRYWTQQFVPGQMTYDLRALQEHTVTVRVPGMKPQVFRAEARPFSSFSNGYGLMEYVPVGGTQSKLEVLDLSSWVMMGGELWAEDGDYQEQYDPNLYRLTLMDGSQWVVDQDAGMVRQIRDASGNQIDISPTGIVHSDGTAMYTHRDAEGRIDWVQDMDKRRIRYNYDGNGDLVSVMDASGAETRFLYDAGHRLREILDPNGVKALRTEFDSVGRMVRQINAKGDTTMYDHDLSNGRERIVQPGGDTVAYEYDANGNVTSETQGGGRKVYSYDADGNLLSTTNPDGSVTRTEWKCWSGQMGRYCNDTASIDALGNRTTRTWESVRGLLLSETDPLGRTTHYAYDAAGRTTRQIDPDGSVHVWSYDGRGNVVRDSSSQGLSIFTYDDFGHLVATRDALGREMSTKRDPRGNALEERDALGRVSKHVYDAQDRLVSTTDALGRTTYTEYTSFGKPRLVTDALGRKTQTIYDAVGQAVTTIRPDGTSSSRTYDAEGNVSATTDAAGRTTIMQYGGEGRLLGTKFADSTEVKSEYDAMGRRTASIDAKGNRTEYEYDAAGRDTLVRDALGRVTKSRYDAVGRKIEVVDALGRSTFTHYDLYDRVTKVIYSDNSFDSTEYDAAGRKTAVVDAMYRRTEFGYDAVGQLVSVKDPSGEITRYGYDANGNRVSQTDAKSRTTTFRYDALSRQTAKVYPDGAIDSTEYDAVGQVARHIAPNGDVTRFEYDVLGRETKLTLPSGKTVSTTWNADGSRASVLDEHGLTQYAYDGRGRLASVTQPDGIVLRYAYDKSGQIVKRGTPWGEVRYVVNALGQVDTVVDSRAGATSYAYDALGRTASVTRPNGVQSIYGYTERGLLGSLRHVRGADEVASFAYTFDASGLRTGAGETFGGVTNPVSWTHDLNQRLTDEIRSGATRSWEYDAVSNRISQTVGGSSIAGAFDIRDRLTSLGNASYTWDIGGRLRSRTVSSAVTRYTWADDDRLTLVDLSSGGSVRYGYDAQGLMVLRTDASGATGFVWDGTQPYGQVVATTSASGALDTRWVYGFERLAEIHGDTVLWLLADGLGNVRAVTDSVGTVVGRQDFDAWGSRTAESGRTSAFGYRGEWADPATGLVFLRARWMDPNTGRFVSEDPYEGDETNPVTRHRFLYAGSGPVNASDPGGKDFTLGGTMAGISGMDILSAMAQVSFSLVTTKIAIDAASTIDFDEINREVLEQMVSLSTVITSTWNDAVALYNAEMTKAREEAERRRKKNGSRYELLVRGPSRDNGALSDNWNKPYLTSPRRWYMDGGPSGRIKGIGLWAPKSGIGSHIEVGELDNHPIKGDPVWGPDKWRYVYHFHIGPHSNGIHYVIGGVP